MQTKSDEIQRLGRLIKDMRQDLKDMLESGIPAGSKTVKGYVDKISRLEEDRVKLQNETVKSKVIFVKTGMEG